MSNSDPLPSWSMPTSESFDSRYTDRTHGHVCHCGLTAVYTEGDDIFRKRFVECPFREGGCHFRKWVDRPHGDHAQYLIREMNDDIQDILHNRRVKYGEDLEYRHEIYAREQEAVAVANTATSRFHIAVVIISVLPVVVAALLWNGITP